MARLGRPHGLDGFLGVYVDDADVVLLQPGSVVVVGGETLEVRAIRRGDRGWQVAFLGVDDRHIAESIRNTDVYAQPRVLGEGEFWPEDLIGLDVRPVGGSVVGVEHGPTQDRLVIEHSGVTFEIPFVEDLVPVVDLDSGYVEIVPVEGLLPEPDQRLE